MTEHTPSHRHPAAPARPDPEAFTVDLLARMDRLPLGRPHYHLLLIGGLGFLWEALDIVTVSFSVPSLREEWGLSLAQAGLITASSPVGQLFGAIACGLIADRIGRRQVMITALVFYCAFTVVGALAPNLEFFLAARVVAGIGLGAELAIIAPFLSEFVPSRSRGWFVGTLGAFLAVGGFLAALLARFVTEPFDDGWRYSQIITALAALMVVWWRRSLPESPRFLLAQGRVAEATAVVEQFERGTLRRPPRGSRGVTPGPSAVPSPVEQPQQPRVSLAVGLRFLWSPTMRRRTAMIWTVWLCFVFTQTAFSTWGPTLLVERGLSLQQSFSYSIGIYFAQIPGYLFGAWLCERIDRRQTLASTMIGAAVGASIFGFAQNDVVLVIGGATFAFFINAVTATLYAYTPEVFPTWIRATGAGFASAIGRIGSISAPLTVGLAVGTVGFAGILGGMAAVLVVAVVVVLTLGVSTAGQSLEEASEPEQVREEMRRLAGETAPAPGGGQETSQDRTAHDHRGAGD